jgi:hypothetical protein
MDALLQLTNKARFAESNLVKFTLADLRALQMQTIHQPYANEKIKTLLEDSGIGMQGMNGAEYGIIASVIANQIMGVRVTGSPYEERTIPAGGSVSYSKQAIVLQTKNGENVTLPNCPLPPSAPVTRTGEEVLVRVLYALFGFNKGKLTLIRDAKLDHDFYGQPQTTYNPAGVSQFKSIIDTLVQKYSGTAHILKDKVTITGHVANDYWYGFVASLSLEDYLSLHSLMIRLLLKQVVVQKDGKTGLERPFSVARAPLNGGQPVAAVPASTFNRVNAPAKEAEAYRQKSKSDSIVWVSPINPVASMLRITTPMDLLSLYKQSMALWGGKSQGIGHLTTYADYCPRQSPTIRRMNWFVMAIHHVKGPKDIHVCPGDLALMNLHIASRKAGSDKDYDDIRLVVSMKETKGQERKDYYVTQGRPSAVQIVIADWITIPDVSPGIKKQADNAATISAQLATYMAFVCELGPRYFIQAPLFTPQQMDGYKISSTSSVTVEPVFFRHGRGHDLMTTITTETQTLHHPNGSHWLDKIPSHGDFMVAVKAALRYFNGWHLCAEPIYNTLGTWLTIAATSVRIDDGDWTHVEFTPVLLAPKTGDMIVLDDGIGDAAESLDLNQAGAAALASVSGNSSVHKPAQAGIQQLPPQLAQLGVAQQGQQSLPATTVSEEPMTFQADEIPDEEPQKDIS